MNIVIDGDSYEAVFFLRSHTVKIRPPGGSSPEWTDDQHLLLPLWVGADYLYAAARAILPANEKGFVVRRLQTEFAGKVPPVRFFELHKYGDDKPDYRHPGKKLSFLDTHDEGNRLHFPPSLLPVARADETALTKWETEQDERKELLAGDILIERIASQSALGVDETDTDADPPPPPPSRRPGGFCKIHIQIGRGDKRPQIPLALATEARIVIVSRRDLVDDVRIRKSISYESILVDLLRLLRRYAAKPEYSKIFHRLTGLPWEEKLPLWLQKTST